MFTHLDTTPALDLKVIDSPAGRMYITPDGNRYPSITTVLSAGDKPWLTEWRNSLGEAAADKEMKRAAARGTAVHAMVEHHLKNAENPAEIVITSKVPIAWNHIEEYKSLRLFLKRINNIYLQEAALYSDTLKIAGRVDCIAEYQGKLSVIDFKTSTNSKKSPTIQDYYLQTTAYALMFQEIYDIQIDNIVIIMSVEKSAVPLVFQQRVDDFIEPLVERINNYYTLSRRPKTNGQHIKTTASTE